MSFLYGLSESCRPGGAARRMPLQVLAAYLGLAWAMTAWPAPCLAQASGQPEVEKQGVPAEEDAPQACGSEVAAMLRPARPAQRRLEVSQVLGSHCRALPGDPKTHLALVVYAPPDARRAMEDGQHPLPVTLVLAAWTGGTARPEHRREWVIEEDPALEVGPLSFRWDGAQYPLSAGVRVAGLRFQSSARGPSCPDQRWSDQLFLLAPGKGGWTLLHGAAMTVQWGVDGPLCGHEGQHDTAQRVLAVQPRPGQAWADLLLIERITRHDRAEGAAPVTRLQTLRLVHDGRRYEPSKGLPHADLMREVLVLPWK